MKTIFSKILLGYLSIILLLAFMILFFSFGSIKKHYINYLTNDLNKYNQLMLQVTQPYLINNSQHNIDSLIKSMSHDINTRISIIDTAGNVIADSKNNIQNMENHKNRPEVIDAFKNKFGVAYRHSTTVDKDMLYVAMPLVYNNRIIAIIRTSLYSDKINELIDDLENKIINITLLVIGLSLIIVFVLSRHITNPISRIVAASKRVATGDFRTKVVTKNRDEMKDLAESFNYMTEHINYLFNQLNDEKEKIDGLITTLHEGFIVIDDSGKLLLANNTFADIIGKTEIIGKYFWELIHDNNFTDFIKIIRLSKTSNSIEIPIGENFYLASANYLTGKGLYVVILHDITKSKELEQIKKDFIVNVSHELRTPLTAIKGFVETMEDEAEGDDLHYLEIIHRHSDRLINIVNDLLLLSNLEDKSSYLVYDKLNFEPYLDNILTIFHQKLADKNLRMMIDIHPNAPIIDADPFKLEQVFINLIDNAIKYTDKGGLTISVKRILHNQIDSVQIDIIDSGIGIAKEQLSRIFERFYVIDKSRSRKVGGTGLGLSIVKHIILLHKGEIKVNSEKGIGTTFSFILPVSKPE